MCIFPFCSELSIKCIQRLRNMEVEMESHCLTNLFFNQNSTFGEKNKLNFSFHLREIFTFVAVLIMQII